MQFRFFHWWLVASTLSVAIAVLQPQTSVVTSTQSLVSSTSGTNPATTISSPTASGDACARLASLARAVPASNPIVPAQAAWECLQAVPFDSTTALAWLSSLRPYIRWQTTLAYLKNPPEGYQLPAYDLYAAYDRIESNIRASKYSNQYEFEFAVYSLFQDAHDGHFSYQPNLVSTIAAFGRKFALVSVSSDGKELPKPYVYDDVLLSYNNSGFEPSAITEIDGMEAVTYLEKFSMNGPLRDLDALWNNLFFGLAAIRAGAIGPAAGLFSGGGRGDVVYPNATTTLAFANGTSTTYENTARLLVSLSNITSAQDLYQRYVDPMLITMRPITRLPDAIPPPGYPSPIIRESHNLASGYYLADKGYEDVAVLSLISFLSGFVDSDNVSSTFIDRAKADGKKKLIIDLSANGGGDVGFGFSLFLKLFPNMFPYLGTRFRATEVFNVMGETVSHWSNGTSDLDRSLGFVSNQFAAFFNGLTPFPYASDVDIDYKQFPNWPTKFGPHQYNGDNFTSIIRWNLSQPVINISTAETPSSQLPPFEPNDIILLTDGYCASTCSNFVEFMTKQAGVKTVTVGGRPNNKSMQAVGGTRGANNYPWFDMVWRYVNLTYTLALSTQSTAQSANLYSDTELGEYVGGTGIDPLLPFRRAALTGNVNVRDNIRKDDQDQIPLHFKYEAADCRIYWTMDMTVNITALWKEVADVAWGDGDCIVGSIPTSAKHKAKRGVHDTSRKRSVQKRRVAPADLDALAGSVSISTDHNIDLSGGGIIMP